MASEVLTVTETPEPSSVDMAEATQEEEPPKLKRAKNKISPPADSPARKSKYAHLMVDSDEEETPEEQVDIGFINMLHERHLAREKEIARKKLVLPSFAMHELPEVPAVTAELFQNYESKSHDEKMQQFQKFKEEQKNTSRV